VINPICSHGGNHGCYQGLEAQRQGQGLEISHQKSVMTRTRTRTNIPADYTWLCHSRADKLIDTGVDATIARLLHGRRVCSLLRLTAEHHRELCSELFTHRTVDDEVEKLVYFTPEPSAGVVCLTIRSNAQTLNHRLNT